MIKNIEVHSKKEMLDICENLDISNCAVISINDKDSEVPWNIAESCGNCLFTRFDDEESGESCIKPDQGTTIIEFFNRVNKNDDIETLHIHCGGGVSRSAAVAGALMKLLWNDDTLVFNNGKFCPNMKVYRTVLESGNVFLTNQELQKKESDQFDIWKSYHKEYF